jgi:hypothetical protein
MPRDLHKLLSRLQARGTDTTLNHVTVTSHFGVSAPQWLVTRSDSEMSAGAEPIIYFNAKNSYGAQIMSWKRVTDICNYFGLHSMQDVAKLPIESVVTETPIHLTEIEEEVLLNIIKICQSRDAYLEHAVADFRREQSAWK